MYPRNGIQSYRKTNVITADPGKLVIMCYEGAIDNLLIAKQKMAAKEYGDKAKALIKAQEIIDELLYSLDFEKGGSVAKNLESLYNYITRRIIQADVNKDIAGFDEVIGILRQLLSAWEQAVAMPAEKVESAQTAYAENQKLQAANI